jgi:hypothetical protein
MSVNEDGTLMRTSTLVTNRSTLVRHFHAICTIRLIMTAILALACLLPIESNAAESSACPNIVILYADDMGHGDLAIQNPDSKIPTPNLDRLASWIDAMAMVGGDVSPCLKEMEENHRAAVLCLMEDYLAFSNKGRTSVATWDQQYAGHDSFANSTQSDGVRKILRDEWGYTD